MKAIDMFGFKATRCMRCGKEMSMPRGDFDFGYEGITDDDQHAAIEEIRVSVAQRQMCWECFVGFVSLLEGYMSAQSANDMVEVIADIDEAAPGLFARTDAPAKTEIEETACGGCTDCS